MSIAPIRMDAVRFVSDGAYEGAGKSRGLARGLLVYLGDLDLTGEGMGIGGVAARGRRHTCFSRSRADEAEGEFGRTFLLDTRMIWSIWGRPSPWLTRLTESAVRVYMRLPSLQLALLSCVPTLRRALRIDPLLETVPVEGRVTVTWAVDEGRVDVRAVVHPPVKPGITICLLNEVSADWFTMAVRGERTAPPPSAWETFSPHDPPDCLYDPVHGIRFTMTRASVSPPPVPWNAFWGRERTGDLCWAGFCLELGPLDGLREPLEARYSIAFAGGVCA